MRWQMQSFTLADAKLCVGDCKALRWQMQCFVLADAMLCVGRCNALRWRMQCFALADAKLCTITSTRLQRNNYRHEILN